MSNNVAKTCAEYDWMAEDWCLIDALLEGTKGMRKAGARFLPQRLMEHDNDWSARLAAATLYPAFSNTVQYMVGRIFADPLLLKDDVPQWIADEVVPNFNMQDQNIHVFFAEVMDRAFSKGVSYVLVDAPPAPEVKTLADQKATGIRPYAVHITADRVIGWQCSGGRLSQVRVTFNEETYNPATFETSLVEQVRVFEPGICRVFEKRRNNQGEETWEEVPEKATRSSLDFIPLVPFYAGRCGFMKARSLLIELAYLNAKHWRAQSATDEITDVAQIPILVAYGIQDAKKIVIGSKTAIAMPTSGALKYTEHTGKAIEGGQAALNALKTEMQDAGARLLAQTAQTKTATESSEDSARENSQLARVVRDMEDSIESVLDIMAEYRGEESGGTIEAQADLDPEMAPISSLDFLLKMAAAGKLSSQTLFEETKRRGIINDEIEWEDEQQRIKEEEPAPDELPVLNPDGTVTPPNNGRPAPLVAP